ncbi:MAG TPA: PAS domain S-box protein [Gemmatimonadales bacterium]|nr:PAS domain S-box protein [Gemmatimonadales bacterium]
MRWLSVLSALPADARLPLLLSGLLPLAAAGAIVWLARRRSLGLATTFTARAGAGIGIGFTALALVATVSVLHTGLRELQRRHIQETAALAEALSRTASTGTLDGQVNQQLALFRAGRPEVGLAAVILPRCAVRCLAMSVDESHAGGASRWLTARAGRFASDRLEVVRLGRTPYLALTSVVRDATGLPRGHLVVAVDAQWVSDQARSTAWLLVVIAYVMLLVVGWMTRRLIAEFVAKRVRTLIGQIAAPTVGEAAQLSEADGAGGDELGALARILDVHIERSLARERESELRYRRLVEASPDAVFVHSEGRIVFLNEAAVRLCGARGVGDLIGRRAAELLEARGIGLGDSRASGEYALTGEFAGGGAGARVGSRVPPLVDGQLRRLDGGAVDVEIAALPMVYEGEPAVQTIVRDVSARRRAEEALRRSEAMYRDLVEHATYGIYRSGLDDRFLAVNRALVRMLGYETEAELLAVPVSQVYVDPADRDRLVAEFADAERIEDVEVHWRRRDGAPLVVRISGQPVRAAAGGLLGFEMIAEDITERRRLEEQLRQAQKMEAVGRLTGGIAHDFNNLLTVILANADLVAGALPADRDDLRADLADLRAASQRGAAMVRKLLAFSRTEKPELRPVDLARLLGEMGDMLRRVLPEHIEIRLRVGASATVRADAGAVEQILLNLATNARDAMPEGGVLELGLDIVEADEEGGPAAAAAAVAGGCGGYVRLSVRDNGCGMDERTRARVFEPFFTTKEQGKGTGLGMAMVYGLVGQHEGFATVESTLGQGTKVCVHFPLWLGERASDGAGDAGEGLRGGTETILLAEDEEPIRRATRRILEKWGYRVLVAEDGAEALATLERSGSEIDLLISDMMMPKVGGRRIYETLRARGSTLPVLFISGYSEEVWAEGDPMTTDAHFLGKPWTVAELVSRVREVLDARPAAAAAEVAGPLAGPGSDPAAQRSASAVA